MRMKALVFGSALLAGALGGPRHADAITGNQWRTFAEISQTVYIMGLADAWRYLWALREISLKNHPNVTASQPTPAESIFVDLAGCARGMTYEQIAAIVRKYMNDTPERWHTDMADIAMSAVLKTCPSQGRP